MTEKVPDTELPLDSTFKDSEGDEWTILLSVGLVEDVKEFAGVDLPLMMKDPKAFSTLMMEDPKRLVMAMYIMLEKQVKDRGLSERQFGKRFDRATLDRCTDAFIDAIIAFYPRGSAGRGLREKLPELLAKMDRTLAEAAGKHVTRMLSDTLTN